jgi:hypothetical protein
VKDKKGRTALRWAEVLGVTHVAAFLRPLASGGCLLM